MQEAWVQDRLDRQCTWGSLRGVVKSVEVLSTQSIESWKLSDSIKLRPLGVNELRSRLPSGEFYVMDAVSQQGFVQLPRCFLTRTIPTITHLTDRGPTVAPVHHFMAYSRFAWSWAFGVYHGMWNSIKNTCKSACGGAFWQCILHFLVYANMNFGPFGSGYWFRLKQTSLSRYMQLNDHRTPAFQHIKTKWARANKLPLVGDSDEVELFKSLATMRSYNEKTTQLKLMRWLSINESWDALEPELWGSKLVLDFINNSSEIMDEASTPGFDGTGHAVSAEIANAMKNKQGTLQKAPDFVCDHNIAMMRIFRVATKTIHEDYSDRAHFIKSMSDAFHYRLYESKGGWSERIQCIATSCFYDQASLQYLDVMDDNAESIQCRAWLLEFFTKLVHFRCQHVLPETHCYPWIIIQAVDPERVSRDAFRQRMLRDLEVLLWAEDLSHRHPGLNRVLSDVWWRELEIARLPLFLNEMENGSCDGEATTRLCESLVAFMPDEKCAEDLHQHCRDEQRSKRAPDLGPCRIMRTCIESQLPSKRRMPEVSATVTDIAAAMMRRPEKCGHQFKPTPTHWPPTLDGLTSRVRAWKSPTQESYYQGVSAWRWLVHWYEYCKNGSQGHVPIASSFRSRLAGVGKILRHYRKMFFVLSVLPWGLVVWDCEMVDAGHARLVLGSDEPIHWLFIWSVAESLVVDVELVYKKAHGLVMKLCKDMPLLEFGLLQGAILNKNDIIALHEEVKSGCGDLKRHGKDRLLHTLASFVFSGDESRVLKCVGASVDGQAGVDYDPVADEKLGDLLEEITLHDAQNAGDVKELRASLRQRATVAISQAREVLRTQARKKKRARILAKAKSKAKKMIKGKAKPKPKALKGPDELPPPFLGAEPALADPPPLALVPLAPLPTEVGDEQPHTPLAPPLGDSVPAPDGPPPLPPPPLAPRAPGVVEYTTPQLLKTLIPEAPGFSISLDVPACRFRGKARGQVLPSVGFGPWTGRSRREALDSILTTIWAHCDDVRPPDTYIDAVAPELWGGILEPRVEQPRKRFRR